MNIVIVGGGSAGRTASIEAAEYAENVTLIEKDKIGGKCLNTGCMVVCGLNDVARFIKNAERFNQIGITNCQPDVDFKKVAEGIIKTTGKIRGVITAETKHAGVNIINGDAEIFDGYVSINGKHLPYDKLIIATGSRALIPPIEGVEHAKTYKDILNYEKVPEKLIIVGSGIIATEFAGIFSAMGTEVHILSRSKYLNQVDPEIKDYIVKNLLENVIIHENVAVTNINPDGLTTKLGPMVGDVLLAVGMVPNSEGVEGLVNTGEQKEIIVNSRMETSAENIYAAGDVVGGIGTTPIARMEGVVAARNACGISSQVDYRYIPTSISLYYDVSFINSDNQDGVEGHIPGSAGPGAFWNVLERQTGVTKALVDIENGNINNISSIAPSARTIMAYMSKLMRDGYKTHDFEDFVESHPSTDAVYKLLRFFSKYG